MHRRSYPILASSLLALVAGGAACGRQLGEPQAPTASQQQASTQLTANIEQITSLKAKPDSVFALYAAFAALGPQAVDPNAKKSSGLTEDLLPADLPAGCVSGSPGTGWTYTNCTSNNTTINGTVKISGDTTTFDLQIKASGQGANVKLSLVGTVTNAANRMTGDITYEVKVDLGGIPNPTGAGDQKTKVVYDITYTTNPTCITAGSIRVDYDVSGGAVSGSAQFEWTGCNMYKVRNG